MSEITFAKQVLVAASSRQVHYKADHVQDLRTLQVRGPFILPKFSGPPKTKRARIETPSLDITFKTLRAPHINVTLPSISLRTPILALKLTLSEKTGVPVEKLKLLIKGKVLNDCSMLKEVTGEGEDVGKGLVVTVMLMGGAVPKDAGATGTTSTVGGTRAPEEGTVTATGAEGEAGSGAGEDKMDVDAIATHPTGKEGIGAFRALKTEQFWKDLKGFVSEKLAKDGEAQHAETVVGVFSAAWEAQVKRGSNGN